MKKHRRTQNADKKYTVYPGTKLVRRTASTNETESTAGNFISLDDVNTELKKTVPGYERENYRTYMTGPEWRNVEMSVEFANFLQSGQPFYRYPYFSQIATFWRIYFLSLKAAHKHHSWFQILFSEYNVMDLFVGVMTTLECLGKGLFSLPFRLIGRRENNTPFQKHVAGIYDNYAKFIHHTPFFLYPFLAEIRPLLSAYWQSSPKTFADAVTLFITPIEMLIRGLAGYIPRKMYSQEDKNTGEVKATADSVLHVILERKDTAETAQLISKIEQENHTSLAEKVVQRKPKKGFLYSHAEFQRYKKFTELVESLALETKDIEIKRIAGQDELQVDFRCKNDKLEEAKKLFGPNLLYVYNNSIDDSVVVVANIKTDQLLEFIRKAKTLNISLQYVHDF